MTFWRNVLSNMLLQGQNALLVVSTCLQNFYQCIDKWSPTNLVPLDKRSPSNLVLMDKWSPKIWSPWTNGPPKFGPHGQMVPNKFVPPGKMAPIIFCCSGGQAVMIWKYGDQIGWGPFVQGDQIFGDHLSRGTKFDGDRLSRETKLFGDHLSMGTKFWGTICPWGQEVGTRSPGIKWVWDQMILSLEFIAVTRMLIGFVKVSYFQNEFMKIKLLPKNERKIARTIFYPHSQSRNPCNFSFVL